MAIVSVYPKHAARTDERPVPRRAGQWAAVAILLLAARPLVAGPLDEGLARFYKNDVEGALPWFEKAAAAEPARPEAFAWLAESYRRLGRREAADSTARLALALAPCHAMAHDVLASNFTAQYGRWARADADSSWAHSRLAVECDSTDGNSWMTLWIEALRRADYERERRAYRRLIGGAFFAHPVIAYNRWMLRGLPARAVLLVNGDLDTYPAMALQEAEGLRTDVAVVNISLLDVAWYRRWVRDRLGVQMPFSPEELDRTDGEYDAGGNWIGAARRLEHGWQEMLRAGILERPLTYSVSLDFDLLPDSTRHLVLEGPYYRAMPWSVEQNVDTAEVRRSVMPLIPADFAGAWVSAGDRSPVRRAAGTMLGNVLACAIAYARVCPERARAVAMLDWGREFALRAGADPRIRDWLERYRDAVASRRR